MYIANLEKKLEITHPRTNDWSPGQLSPRVSSWRAEGQPQAEISCPSPLPPDSRDYDHRHVARAAQTQNGSS